MAKGNMTTGGTAATPKDMVAMAMKERETLAKEIEGMKQSAERDSKLAELYLLDIEIRHRKDNAIEAESLLKNATHEVRNRVSDINNSLMENDIARETLNGLSRKASKEQDDLRDKLVDLRFEAKGKDTDEIVRMNRRIKYLSDKMTMYQNQIRDLIKLSGELRSEKAEILYKAKV